MQQEIGESAWRNFTDSLSAQFAMPPEARYNMTPILAQMPPDDWGNNVTSNSSDMTAVEKFAKRLQQLIIDDDGSFLYIPFSGAIYIALVFFVLVVTYCRHFSQVSDRRIRWIRHSTNSTCLTGPGTMTVICNNWVYLCRQHGHFGISRKAAGHQMKKVKVTMKDKKTIEMSVEDVTVEQSGVASNDSNQDQQDQQGDSDVPTVSSAVPMRRAGSHCFPWTSYPTPSGPISYRELGEPAPNSPRYRPETPAGQYYCVSGRHTPADEVLEFWDYTPELERKATGEHLSAMAGPSTSGTSGPRTTNNVSFAANLPTNGTSSPSSPGSPASLLPRPSLQTPNLSALARAAPAVGHGHRRRSSHRRQTTSIQPPSDDDVDHGWNELMAAMMAKPTEGSKPTLSNEQGASEPFRERTGSTGSNSNKEALQMHQMRSYSPATVRRQQTIMAPSGSRPVIQRNTGGDDDSTRGRTAPGGILAIVRMGQEMRKQQSRYN